MGSTLLINNPFAIITFIAAPAVLMNATSVLAMSTSARMLRARELVHALYKESEVRAQSPDGILLAQVDHAERQALLLLTALNWIYTALGAFAAASLVTLLGAAAEELKNEFAMHLAMTVGLILGLGGVTGVVSGCVNLFRATQFSVVNTREQAAAIRARHTSEKK
jgi:hypothetical protein